MGLLCKDEGYHFHWQPYSHRPSLTSPDGKYSVQCDATQEYTATVGRVCYKMIAPSSEADADSEPEAHQPIALPGDSSIVDCPMPRIYDENHEVVPETLRRDQTNLIYKPVPSWVNDIDTIFYDGDNKTVHITQYQRRDGARLCCRVQEEHRGDVHALAVGALDLEPFHLGRQPGCAMRPGCWRVCDPRLNDQI